MKPPSVLSVVDKHGGLTVIGPGGARIGRRPLDAWGTGEGSDFWRPARGLRSTVGWLVSWNAKSFYQLNNNVTRAVYRLSGYPHPVLVWFDNATGKRIA